MATEHINGNGPEEPMDTSAAVTHSEHFQTLLEAGLPQKVAEKLDEIYIAGKAQWIYLHIEICNFQCLTIFFLFFFACIVIFLSSFWMGWSAPEATFCGFLPKWVLQCYKMIKLHISSVKMWQTFKHLYSQHDWLVSGRMDFFKKERNLFNTHVLTTKCCLCSAL